MKLEDILDVAKRRGFFWQSAAIHGSMSGFYDYAHLGTALKHRWENEWRSFFLGLDDNFWEIEPCNVLPENVFKASGHLESFVDPIAKCGKCDYTERADHLLERELKDDTFEGLSPEEFMKLMEKHKIKCPKCNGYFKEVGQLNMMFPLTVGTGSDARTAYLTPETAQGVYVNFKQEFETLRRKIPMGLAVVGKAYRNEISPRNALIRMREFTQAELQIFFDPNDVDKHEDFKSVANYKLRVFLMKNRKSKKITEVACKNMKLPKFYVYHMAMMQKFYLDVMKVPKSKFRFKELSDEEKAFYNKYHWDAEVNTNSFGWIEMGGLHFRTDHDLKGHEKVSGEKMMINHEGRVFVPNVLEISMGVDRNIYMLIDLFYKEEKERTIINFPRVFSPFDLGLFPLVNKDKLPKKAEEIKEMLKNDGLKIFYDNSGSIGRRYRRMDEIGVSLSVTVDHQTLKNNTVTIRNRDTMKQIRVKIDNLSKVIKNIINCKTDFKKAGKIVK
ncbi:MAG: glycine--tRNA ligase [Nanoarchaeota archaeon]|nr:glycine--tRNA ligase [Nanoarchaeota archaeon]